MKLTKFELAFLFLAIFSGIVAISNSPPKAHASRLLYPYPYPYPSPYPMVYDIISPKNRPNLSPNIDFTITFSENVTGVDETDFQLISPGLPDAVITGISGSGAIYTVSINTGSGKGTIHLNLLDDDSIINGISYPLGGAGLNNGNFTTGDTYPVIIHMPVTSTNMDITPKNKPTDMGDPQPESEPDSVDDQSNSQTESAISPQEPVLITNKPFTKLAKRH